MRDYQTNAWGMGKVEDDLQRSTGDIALSTSAGALQGAQAGMAFGGPIGAGVGAAVGAGAMLYANLEGKADEQRQEAAARSRNTGIDNLAGRAAMRTDRITPAQLEYGMNMSRYDEDVRAEVEGGRHYDMGGEIVVDKNFNEKFDATGYPTHEEGGVDLNLKEGDIVFPTQNSKEKYRKIKRALRKYKMSGDKNSKEYKYLVKERDKLPTDEDYAEQEELMASQGMRMYPNGSGGVLPPMNPSTRDFETNEERRKRLEREARQREREETQQLRRDRRHLRENERFHDTSQKAERFGTIRDKFRKKEKLMTDGVPVLEEWESKKRLKDYVGDVFDTGKAGEQEGQPQVKPEQIQGFTPDQKPKAQPKGGETNTNLGIANKSKDVAESGGAGKAADQIGLYNNPLKYASVIKNTIEGTEAAHKETRRYLEADPYEYRDTSAAKRRAAMEQRNAQMRMLQGRVDRSGSLGTNAQLTSQYMGQMEAINEAEAAKQLATDQANTQLMNQISQANTQLDIGYDEKDLQNEAARQAFASTAAAEAAELAQYDEQRRYMRDLDQRQFQRDQDILDSGLLQSRRYVWENGQVKLKSQSDPKVNKTNITLDGDSEDNTKIFGEKGVNVTKKKKSKKSKGFRMMPDGRVIKQ
jgi:hypothetical protein